MQSSLTKYIGGHLHKKAVRRQRLPQCRRKGAAASGKQVSGSSLRGWSLPQLSYTAHGYRIKDLICNTTSRDVFFYNFPWTHSCFQPVAAFAMRWYHTAVVDVAAVTRPRQSIHPYFHLGPCLSALIESSKIMKRVITIWCTQPNRRNMIELKRCWQSFLRGKLPTWTWPGDIYSLYYKPRKSCLEQIQDDLLHY